MHQQQRHQCRQASSSKPLKISQEDHAHLKININICTGLSELEALLDTRSLQTPAQRWCNSLLGSSLASCHYGEGAAFAAAHKFPGPLCNGRQHQDEVLTLLCVL